MLSLPILAACAGGKPLYDGPRRARQEVALLRPDARATITAVDGKEVRGNAFEVLPGQHELRFKVLLMGDDVNEVYKGLRNTTECVGAFVAEAGHTYRVDKAPARVLSSESNVSQRVGTFEAGEIAILDWKEEGRPPVGTVECGAYRSRGR